jgi:proton-dependent oligopeptide transporter, POT family
MRLDGTPNDIVQNLDPIVLIIFIPIMDQFVYPYIAKKGWNFTPIKKMALGFQMGTAAMICAAVTQYYIYQKSPCGYNASDQDCIAELGPPDISVWVQALSYAFVAWSEIFTSVVGLEYAFTKAPKNMRSSVTAIFWYAFPH